MLSQFIEVSADNLGADSGLKAGMYYFGGDDDGSMKTGSQSVKDDNGDSYKFFFENKTTGNTKGLGITGNKSGYLYFKGLLIKADDYKYQVATLEDQNGQKYDSHHQLQRFHPALLWYNIQRGWSGSHRC